MSTTLYYAPGSASLLVHWLLIELELPHELRLVDTAAKAQKSPDYLALNPNGVVPTLVIDGMPQYEAAALAMLLAERHPQAGFAPAIGDPRRADYMQWMFNLANMVQPLFRQWWYPAEPAGEAREAGGASAEVHGMARGAAQSLKHTPSGRASSRLRHFVGARRERKRR